jgi:hypothetical protein
VARMTGVWWEHLRKRSFWGPLYPQKLALTSPTGGGRSVGIVRSRAEAMEFGFRRKWQKSTKIDHQDVEWRRRLERSCLGEGQVRGCCKCGDESLGSIKCEEFLD